MQTMALCITIGHKFDLLCPNPQGLACSRAGCNGVQSKMRTAAI